MFPTNIAHSPAATLLNWSDLKYKQQVLKELWKINLFLQFIKVKISKTKQKHAIHLSSTVPVEYAGWWMIFVNVIIPRMYLLKSHFSISVAVNYFIKNGTEDVLLCGNSTDAG